MLTCRMEIEVEELVRDTVEDLADVCGLSISQVCNRLFIEALREKFKNKRMEEIENGSAFRRKGCWN